LEQGFQGSLDSLREEEGAKGVTLLHFPGRPDDLPPDQQGGGWKACRTHRIMEGHNHSRASSMAVRAMELIAFFKATCTRSHPVLPCRAST